MKEKRSSSFVTLGYLRSLFNYLEMRSIPLRPVLEAIGLPPPVPGIPLNPDLPLLGVSEDHAFEAAAELTGDANIGLHVGQQFQLSGHGVLGYMILTCASIREVMDLHLRYRQLVGNSTQPRYEIAGEQFYLALCRSEGLPRHARHSIEFSFSACTAIARAISSGRMQPLRVEFQHAPPAGRAEVDRFFACPLRYGCAENRLYFAAAQLDLQLSYGNSSLLPVLEQEAIKRLRQLRQTLIEVDPGLEQLKQYIVERLAHGVPDIGTAAAALGLSARRLQRELALHNTHYRQMVELVRQESAGHYMSNSSLSLVDVAMMLGFSEQSAFQRAFRRWFKMTPGEYRKTAQTTAGANAPVRSGAAVGTA